MGVGRNLSYKKQLFFKNKGFSSVNHLPGGDDDLFINQVASRSNTRIVIDPDSFTMSEPKKSFRDWFKQKTRHFSTAKFYRPKQKWLLGIYTLSQFLFYPVFVVSLIFAAWTWTLAVFGLRFLLQGIVYFKTMKRLNESDLFPFWWLLDIWMTIYFLIFAPSVWKKPRMEWR